MASLAMSLFGVPGRRTVAAKRIDSGRRWLHVFGVGTTPMRARTVQQARRGVAKMVKLKADGNWPVNQLVGITMCEQRLIINRDFAVAIRVENPSP